MTNENRAIGNLTVLKSHKLAYCRTWSWSLTRDLLAFWDSPSINLYSKESCWAVLLPCFTSTRVTVTCQNVRQNINSSLEKNIHNPCDFDMKNLLRKSCLFTLMWHCAVPHELMLTVGFQLSVQRMTLCSFRLFIPRTFIPPRNQVRTVECAITLLISSLGHFAAKSSEP